jgi:putative DNA primase/helicase
MYGGGSNGKTVFIELLQWLLGDYSMTSRTEVVMARQRSGNTNELARLHGPRFVTMNETREGEKLDEPTVKDITGGDKISARFLYCEPFDFHPEFKLWLRGNHKPAITGTDDGIWRRIHLVPFGVQFTEESKDVDIGVKLQRELDGILAWCVQGCVEWRRQGLNPPDKVVAAIKEYREDSDMLAQFIEDQCQIGEGLKTGCKPLFDKFVEWTGHDTKMTNRSFAPAMEVKGFPKSSRTNQGYFYMGIAPISAPQWSDSY